MSDPITSASLQVPNPPPVPPPQRSWLGRTLTAACSGVAATTHTVFHPIEAAQGLAGRRVISFVTDRIGTEEGRTQLLEMFRRWLGNEEGTVADALTGRFNELYRFLTSEEGETRAEALLQQIFGAVGAEALKEAPEEAQVDAKLRETLGETALQTCQMMSEYSLNMLDYDALEYAQHHPTGSCVVLDLGRGADARNGGLTRPMSDIVSELEFVDDKPPGDFVWIHIQDLPQGRSLWVRRERDKMRSEMQHLSKIGLLNLRKACSDLYDGEHRQGAKLSIKTEKLLSDVFATAADHMGSYEQREPGRETDLTERMTVAAARSKKLLFPGGAQDYPLPAHLRVVFDAVLPLMFATGIEQGFKKMGEPAMMNKVLLAALEPIPKPDEIRPSFQEAGPSILMDDNLKEKAGELIVTLLRSSSVDFRRFHDKINPKFDALFDVNLFRTLEIQKSLGELLGEEVINWFARYESGDDLLRCILQSVNEDFLQPKLYGAELRSEEQAVVEEETEVKEQLGSRLKDFIPYVRSTFFKAFEQNSHQLAQKITGKFFLIPQRRKVTTVFCIALDGLIRKVFSWAGSLKGRFFRIIELEQVEKKWHDQASKMLAERALPQFYDVRHRDLMMSLTEIFLNNLEGEDQPSPAQEIRKPPI